MLCNRLVKSKGTCACHGISRASSDPKLYRPSGRILHRETISHCKVNRLSPYATMPLKCPQVASRGKKGTPPHPSSRSSTNQGPLCKPSSVNLRSSKFSARARRERRKLAMFNFLCIGQDKRCASNSCTRTSPCHVSTSIFCYTISFGAKLLRDIFFQCSKPNAIENYEGTIALHTSIKRSQKCYKRVENLSFRLRTRSATPDAGIRQ